MSQCFELVLLEWWKRLLDERKEWSINTLLKRNLFSLTILGIDN